MENMKYALVLVLLASGCKSPKELPPRYETEYSRACDGRRGHRSGDIEVNFIPNSYDAREVEVEILLFP